MGAGEAADEALGADDPDLDAADLEDPMLALEHLDAALGERGGHLGGPVDVVVVVAEHGKHRHVEAGAGLDEHLGLLALAVRREVPGEEEQVNVARQAGERRLRLLALRGAAVDVAHRGDTDARAALGREALGLHGVRAYPAGAAGTTRPCRIPAPSSSRSPRA